MDRTGGDQPAGGPGEIQGSGRGGGTRPGGASISDTLRTISLGSTGPRGGRHDGLVQSAAKSAAARSVGSGVGRAILRGMLGSILGGSGSRRR